MNIARIPLLALLALMLNACGHDDSATGEHAHADSHAHADAAKGEAEGDHDDHDEHADEHAHAAAEAASGDGHADSTRIAAAIATENGIRVAAATAGTIADEHEVQGLLTPVDGRIAQLTARFPGPIRALHAQVGDHVRAGQVLARIESNLSLSQYAVTAPISGVVLARTAQVGGMAAEGAPLFEIADLSTLWVDLHIFGSDTQHITAGVPVTVTRMTDGSSETTTLERVLPGTATASQSTVARALLRNRDGLWRPGAAVKARITVASSPAPLVVPLSALQTLEGSEVVFVRSGEDLYSARKVQLGQRDGERVAVLSGLRAGELVVIEQSYLIKADIGKAAASHEH
jgi:cobalt-zinc-cadmium efflux system membrane fusion protein